MLFRRIIGGMLLPIVCLIFNTLIYAQFYYYKDEHIPLYIDSTKVSVKLDSTISLKDGYSIIESFARIEAILEDPNAIDDFVTCSLLTLDGYEAFIDTLRQFSGISWAEPYYNMNGNISAPVGQTFFVCFDPVVSQSAIDSINTLYSVSPVRKINGTESIYIFQNNPASGTSVLDLANLYHNFDCVIFAHPNFGTRSQPFSYRLFDYYNFRQDHIKKVIGEFNENTVWDFAGVDREVIVAVIDDRIYEHEDLPASRLLPEYDFTEHTGLPTFDLAHGEACAGIIAASHTTDSAYDGIWCPWTGMISMNPKAKILPIRIYEGLSEYSDDVIGGSVVSICDAMSSAYENGTDVISNSYGWPHWPNIQAIDTMIKLNYFDGRFGLGTPVIFASGNYAFDLPGTVSYPARIPYTLAVGAIDLDDERWWYSQYGPELDVVAPSGEDDVWTLDYMGDGGLNPYFEEDTGIPYACNCPSYQNNDVDYNCHFGGTSAAAPIVAGIASLLIARDSTITAQEVYNVIRYSAETNLETGQITVPYTELGYGRADAYRAMLAITRGDANNDGDINIGDAVYMIQNVFQGGPAAQPDFRVGDANCDGMIDVGDTVYLINYVFHGGPPPPLCYEYDY